MSKYVKERGTWINDIPQYRIDEMRKEVFGSMPKFKKTDTALTGCLAALVLIVLGVVVVACFSALTAWVFMLLWNWIMPYLFKLPELTFWMAWGLMFLCQLLFGGLIKVNSKE